MEKVARKLAKIEMVEEVQRNSHWRACSVGGPGDEETLPAAIIGNSDTLGMNKSHVTLLKREWIVCAHLARQLVGKDYIPASLLCEEQ